MPLTIVPPVPTPTPPSTPPVPPSLWLFIGMSRERAEVQPVAAPKATTITTIKTCENPPRRRFEILCLANPDMIPQFVPSPSRE